MGASPSVAGTIAPQQALLHNHERLQLWLQLTEGVQTLRHALAFQPFFDAALPYPAQRHQFFHGMPSGANICVGARFKRDGYHIDRPADRRVAHSMLLSALPPQLAMRGAAQTVLQAWLDRLDSDMGAQQLTWRAWLNLFYWQNRALQWGADDMSAKDVMSWHWTPLLNGELIKMYLRLPQHKRTGKQLIEEMTTALLPALRVATVELAARATSGAF